MSLSHMLLLGVIALMVIPPEKLPEMARQLAKFLYEIKHSADQIMTELKQEAVFKPEDILDKNIKQKLSEIQASLNEPINIDLNTAPQNNHNHIDPHAAHTNQVAQAETPIEKKKND